MTDSDVQTASKGRRRKRKVSGGEPKQPTVIERSVVSPNWQNFLKSQIKTEKKPKDSKASAMDKEISAYWKTKRLEKKAGDITSPSKHLKNLNIDAKSNEAARTVAKSDLFENPSNIEEVIQNNSYWKNRRLQKKNGTKVTDGGAAKTIDKTPSAKSANSNLEKSENTNANETKQESAKPRQSLTKFVAIDCEMVGIGSGGRDSMLARVSLVNKFGDCIYDKFVQPREKVVDYRTPVSGIRKEDLATGESFEVVQREVAEILRGRFLVGHALKKDLEVLFLSHPKRKIRDTSKYKPFRRLAMGSTPSLKRLAKELLGVGIQGGEHSSVEDARAAMQLYCTHQAQWEAALLARDNKNN